MCLQKASMSNKQIILLALTLSVIAATLPFVCYAGNFNSVVPGSRLINGTKVISADDGSQVLSFEVTPAGFEPGEVIIRRGKCLILLQNRTGIRALNFWVIRENEGRVAESDSQKRDWKTQLNLNPGTYILGVTGHPEWKSVIRVTN